MDKRILELLEVLKEFFDNRYPVYADGRPFDGLETFAERVETCLKEFRQTNN